VLLYEALGDFAVMSLVLGAVATRLNAEEKKPVAKKTDV